MDIKNYLVAKHEIGGAKVHVFGKGPSANPLDWRLYNQNSFAVRPRHESAIGHTQPPTDSQTHIYCPNCSTFNAVIGSGDKLSLVAPRGPLLFHCGGYGNEIAGLVLPKRAAALFATADCPTVAIEHLPTQKVVCAHAGLNELINRGRIHREPMKREHDSVIGKMLKQFDQGEIENLRVGIYCGISSRYFRYPPDHREFGAHNRQLIEHLRRTYRAYADMICEDTGRINLKELISRQLEIGGISRTQVKLCNLDTYADERLWSHSEGVAKGESGNPSARNLIVVTNW